jgi:4-hydroxybenzoate polyprenyltransferase
MTENPQTKDDPGEPAAPRIGVSLQAVFFALRPSQWTKNAIVLAAFIFAFWDRSQSLSLLGGLALVAPAVILFCMVSSGIYIFNDIRDIDADRQHPTKKYRPIAAGRVPVALARRLGAALLLTGAAGGWLLAPAFGATVAAYILLQIIYTFWLKRIALVDVFVIAAGFVLRAVAGAVVLSVEISVWLLLCTFLLALFIALCKRRHERILFSDTGTQARENLAKYDERLLDQLISIAASATLVCYAIYTMSPGTIEKFGTASLGLTVPFVAFGIFRYLDLAYRHDKGGRPEKILLTDMPILVNLALYGICVVLIFLLHS